MWVRTSNACLVETESGAQIYVVTQNDPSHSVQFEAQGGLGHSVMLLSSAGEKALLRGVSRKEAEAAFERLAVELKALDLAAIAASAA